MRLATVLTLLLAFLAATAARAQEDVAGAADHPLVKRYAGSWILAYQFHEFDEVTLPTGKQLAYDKSFESTLDVEGAWTRLIYVAPEQRSSLEVFRNYQKDLEAAGFQLLYQCKEEACGPNNGGALVNFMLYPLGERLTSSGQASEYAFSFPKDVRYLVARKLRPEGDLYVSLYVAIETFDLDKRTQDHALALLDVIETKGMQENMVVVEASAIDKSIRETGRIALYGITFDTASTVIKPESADSLAQVVKYLTDNPGVGLYIVGHTDNEGSFDYNLDLSYRRAAAVVEWLVGQGIDAGRLKAAGAGLMAPVAPNTTEAGRAKNRRVELVPQ
jgi:outer membrane protein OmpA-like peptidoglycan-associated protein